MSSPSPRANLPLPRHKEAHEATPSPSDTEGSTKKKMRLGDSEEQERISKEASEEAPSQEKLQEKPQEKPAESEGSEASRKPASEGGNTSNSSSSSHGVQGVGSLAKSTTPKSDEPPVTAVAAVEVRVEGGGGGGGATVALDPAIVDDAFTQVLMCDEPGDDSFSRSIVVKYFEQVEETLPKLKDLM